VNCKMNNFIDEAEAFFWLGATSGGLTLQEAQVRLGKRARMKDSYEESSDDNDQCTESQQLQINNVQTTDNEDKIIHDNANFVIFDTETTGISKNDVVIQMCYILHTEDGKVIDTYNRYWKKPDNIFINPRAQRTHRISKHILEQHGYDTRQELANIIKKFETFRQNNIKIIAHNVAFDNRLLSQTCIRHQIEWPFEKEDFFCTMKNARSYVNARDVNGNVKAPTNVELYKFVEGTNPDGNLHDAHVDCQVTSAGFLGGKRKGWW